MATIALILIQRLAVNKGDSNVQYAIALGSGYSELCGKLLGREWLREAG